MRSLRCAKCHYEWRLSLPNAVPFFKIDKTHSEQNELSRSGRAAQPEEITSVIAFLASDDASVGMAEICP